jgi:hypothetical protein
MKKMFSRLTVIFLVFFYSTKIHSQDKGFVILKANTELSQSEAKKIETHNYDEYRFYTIRKKIQIVRGPLIELLSVSEMQKLGFNFSKSYLDMVKSKSESFKHESILNLDLGLGLYPAYEPK